MICFTVAEKLDRELFTTSILFTFFQTFPGRLKRDVTMAQALDYDSLLVWSAVCSLRMSYTGLRMGTVSTKLLPIYRVAHQGIFERTLTKAIILLTIFLTFIRTKQHIEANRLPVPYRLATGTRFSKVPVTFQARSQIFKSKYKE